MYIGRENFTVIEQNVKSYWRITETMTVQGYIYKGVNFYDFFAFLKGTSFKGVFDDSYLQPR